MGLKAFISYAREDKARALYYYDLLKEEGIDPWIDIQHILPGQNWGAEIERAFNDANVIILLLSKKSVTKRGFVQKEANNAIERLRLKQPTDIYIIPLLIEPCDVPSYIADRLQYVDVTNPDAWKQVTAALKLAAEQQSIEIESGIPAGPFSVFTETTCETWEGHPGYDVTIDYPRFKSAFQPDIASELSALFLGRAYKTLTQGRPKPWAQDRERFRRISPAVAMNWRREAFGIVHATERFLSLTYDIGWYGAGAAHPNSYSETYNFAYLDKLYLLTLEDFFLNPDEAARQISEVCIRELAKEFWKRRGSQPEEFQKESFASGAGPNLKHFRAFTVGADRFTFLFAPYQVSSYAMGRWSAEVLFYDLLGCLRPDGPHLLVLAQA